MSQDYLIETKDKEKDHSDKRYKFFLTKKKKEHLIEIAGKLYKVPSFTRRVFSWIIDSMILAIGTQPITYFFYSFFDIDLSHLNIASEKGIDFSQIDKIFVIKYLCVQSLIALIAIIYISWCITRFGRTIGKFFTGCFVLDTKTGEKLTIEKSVNRSFMSIVSLVSLLGIAMIPFNRKKRALHDIVMNTNVVLIE